MYETNSIKNFKKMKDDVILGLSKNTRRKE